MEVTRAQVRAFRLRAHHLDRRLPPEGLLAAAGACGIQNSPPGAFETAMFNRVEGCSPQALRRALYEERRLLQAWSYRGAPVVFPAEESGAFLTALIAHEGEAPWIYTQGIGLALDFLGMDADDLLFRVKDACALLDGRTVRGKEALDQALADAVEPGLPAGKRALWRAPSMYGGQGRQTVGGAAVSFLLRPCSFCSLVVFGEREGASPTFTSFARWTGRAPSEAPDAARALARKFLHCYGPTDESALMAWLGCTRPQARRIFAAADGVEAVRVEGKRRFVLAQDAEALRLGAQEDDRLRLLGPHDPYLDLRDREVILQERAQQLIVWRTVGNPGVILRGGRVAGVWTARVRGERLDVLLTPFEAGVRARSGELAALAEEYAAFRALHLAQCRVEDA